MAEASFLASAQTGTVSTADPGAKELSERLVKALTQEEFILFGQAIVPISPKGDEAPFQEILIRFKEEEERLLPPGAFLPVLEQCCLMRHVDRWVVSRVARWTPYARMTVPGQRTPRSSLNLSPDTLQDAGFPPHVQRVVKGAELPEGTLSFELGLDTAAAGLASLGNLTAALRQSGCHLVLAGFDGSARALAALGKLIPKWVKISPSVVRATLRNPGDKAALDAIVRSCRHLGVGTIAEYVEDAETLALLREVGVDYAQGYGIRLPERLA